MYSSEAEEELDTYEAIYQGKKPRALTEGEEKSTLKVGWCYPEKSGKLLEFAESEAKSGSKPVDVKTVDEIKAGLDEESTTKSQKVEEESVEEGKSKEAKSSKRVFPGGWMPLDGTTFYVRFGPNYASTKMKKPSKKAFYECIGVDCVASPKKISNIGRFYYPSTGKTKKSSEKMSKIPERFVFALQLPDYAPSMMSYQSDGEGYTIICHYQLTEEAKKLIKDDKVPAVGVLRRFLDAVKAGGGPQKTEHPLYLRPKVIMRLVNHEALDLGFVHRKVCGVFNAKPFLSRPEHTFHIANDESYFEIDVDVHMFKYFQRKCAHSFRDKFSRAVIDVGIVIESQGDKEMPEQMLGACQIQCLKHRFFGLVSEKKSELNKTEEKKSASPSSPTAPTNAPPPPPPSTSSSITAGLAKKLGF